MEISVNPWATAKEVADFGLFEEVDYSEENRQVVRHPRIDSSNSSTDEVDVSISSTSSSKSKKTKKGGIIYRINTTKALSEMKLLRNLVKQNKWKENLMGDEGDIMWSGNSMSHEQYGYLDIALNRFPKMEELTHKKTTGYFLNQFKEYFPHHFDFFPRTFLVPEQLDEVKAAFGKKKNALFIAKPSSGCQGDGIKLVQQMSDLPISQFTPHANQLVVQEYLDSPMLIGDKKFDLRLYVLITSLDPLIVFIHEEGLARFCTETYQKPSKENINNSFMHLTNYSLNKNSPNFLLPTAEDLFKENVASKRTMNVTWKQIQANGYNKESIVQQIEDLVRKFIASMHPYLLYNYKLAFNGKEPKRFHVIGIDILLDKNGKPWFIEANANPSFNIEHEVYQPDGKKKKEESPLDEYVKTRVVEDSIRIVMQSPVKQLAIGRGCSYRGFKLIVQNDLHPEFSEMGIFADILRIFGKLSGCKFNGALTGSKFEKLAAFEGMKNASLIKNDYALIFKKITRLSYENNQMSFFDFIEAIELLASRLKPDIYNKDNKLPAVSELVANIIRQM